jgi:hypothetical protein
LFTDIPKTRFILEQKEGAFGLAGTSGFANGLLLDARSDLLLMGNHQSTGETKRQIGKIVNPKSNKLITDFITNYDGKNLIVRMILL